ncbi:MAG: Acg family FMN-binding oxidoreductase [Methanothrix sp.]
MTAKNYEAWEVKESDYPADGPMEERLKFLLRYAILAPSGPNTQPWKFAINDGSVSVFADLSRALPFVDPSNRTLYMSVGCAIANLAVAGAHFGFAPHVSYFPDGQESDLVAEVQLSPGEKDLQEDLFPQIQRRHTTKDRYDDGIIEPLTLEEIKKSINLPGLYLSYLGDKDSKAKMADLVSRSHQIQLAKKEFRHNLGEWLRNNWTAEPDGMPLYTFGVPDAVSLGFPAAFKEFDLSRPVIYRDSGLIHGCSTLAALTTDQDDKLTWTVCGFALENLLLRATSYDIRASFFSQPIGLPILREELKAQINHGHPQLIFSLGMAKPMRPSPRRPLEDVIIKQS